MTKNTMSFSPPSRFGPPGSLSDRQFGPPVLSTSGNWVRFGLVAETIWGMSVYRANIYIKFITINFHVPEYHKYIIILLNKY